MVLGNIENQKQIRSPIGKDSPRRQRIISESTGLVKFNLAQKAQQKEESIKDFQSLEQKAANNEPLSPSPLKNGLRLQGAVSPKKSSLEPPFSPTKSKPSGRRNLGMINENMMLELASKQREVLELKSNMELLKKKLSQSEKELWEIEKKCNRTTASTLPPALSPTRRTPTSSTQRLSPTRSINNTHEQANSQLSPGLRSKQSLSAIKASIEQSFEATAKEQSQNFSQLKNKISIQQLTNNTANLNFKNFQKDITTNWNKSVNAFSNLKMEFINSHSNQNTRANTRSNTSESEQDEDEAYESDASDYGCADASDYQIAVK